MSRVDNLLRAVIVSVEYTDLLSITLPYNRHHFDEVCIITSNLDAHNLRELCYREEAELFSTDAFYDDGAEFNKWKALEEGLDWYGREGWLCLMDADILWPKGIEVRRYLTPGYLLGPLRKMIPTEGVISEKYKDENQWCDYPTHPNVNEWAGYTQIFHAKDPVLLSSPPPWHQTDWIHGGGADSFFQAKWPPHRRLRLPFFVMHLGESGVNWMGRSSPIIRSRMDESDKSDRSIPIPEIDEKVMDTRRRKLREMLRRRRLNRKKSIEDRFRDERIQ